MRPLPRFQTRARRGQKKLLLAIGSVEEGGSLVVYTVEDEGLHSQITYLQSSGGSYGVWRAYMMELDRIEGEDWIIERRDVPRPSEIELLDKKKRS